MEVPSPGEVVAGARRDVARAGGDAGCVSAWLDRWLLAGAPEEARRPDDQQAETPEYLHDGRSVVVVVPAEQAVQAGLILSRMVHQFGKLRHRKSWAIQEPELPQVHAEAVGGEDYVETIRDVEADRVQEDTPLAREDARGGVGEAIGVAAG